MTQTQGIVALSNLGERALQRADAPGPVRIEPSGENNYTVQIGSLPILSMRVDGGTIRFDEED